MKKLNSGFQISILFAAVALVLLSAPKQSLAGWADTLPKHGMVIETSFLSNVVRTQFDEKRQEEPLAEIDMYAPTGEFLGTIVANAEALTQTLVTQIAVGVTDRLTMAIAIPLVTHRQVDLGLDWEEGDFSNDLGRPYSEDDFWAWAGSMGQDKPPDWMDTDATVGDIILVLLYNFVNRPRFAFTTMGFVNTGSGEDPDPEILGAYGTTMFDFGFMGDIGLHALIDFKFPETRFLKRVTLGLEPYYEHFWDRRYKAPTGRDNPLISNDAPYIGDHYPMQPGDYFGYNAGIHVELIKGPKKPSWLTRSNPEFQAMMPAILSLDLLFSHMLSFDSIYESKSEVWNDEKEEDNAAADKFTLGGKVTLSLLRYGIPLDIYAKYSNQEIIAGKNFTPIIGWGLGARIYYSLDFFPLDQLKKNIGTPKMWF
ncbi:hypothetical protein ACFL4G_07735 [Thermodesulfobacteriota bacterium]